MKKSMLKILIMTLVMSLILVSGVFAESTLESISVYLNKGVTLTWNGVAFYPREDDGTRVYPITYNSRTYLPVKFVAEKAGLTVKWYGDTQTVALSNEGNEEVNNNQSNTNEIKESGLELVDAYLNKGIILTWNGEAFYPCEDDGTRVFPITYNSRTYLPVKFVAEKAGLIVGWDADTQTVSLSNGTNEIPQISTGDVEIKNDSYSHLSEVYTDVEIRPETPILSNNLTADFDSDLKTRTTGKYTRVGNGKTQLFSFDFAAFTEIGCDVEESLAVTNKDKHMVKISLSSGDVIEKREIHIQVLEKLSKAFQEEGGWSLSYSEPLENGHLKNTYWHFIQPLDLTAYSNDNEVVFSITGQQ